MVPSEALIERRPLWPPSPPPRFTRTSPAGMSSSSWTTTSRSTSTEKNPSSALTGPPDSFMYVDGTRQDRPRPGGAAGRRTEAHLADRRPGLVRLERRGGGLAAAAAGRAGVVPPGQLVDDHRPDVVPVAGVRRPGVAEPHDEPRVGVHGRRLWRGSPGPVTTPPRSGRGADARTGPGRVLVRGRPDGALEVWPQASSEVSSPADPPSASPCDPPSAACSASSSSDGSRSIPASASASASSASSSSAETCCGDVDDERLLVGDQGRALGQLHLARRAPGCRR